MQKINRYSVFTWYESRVHPLIRKYQQTAFGFARLRTVVDEYWLPGQRNRDRLVQECSERALNEAPAGYHDSDEPS